MLSTLCFTAITENYYIQKGAPDFLSDQYMIVEINQSQEDNITTVKINDLINYFNSKDCSFIIYKDFSFSGGKAVYLGGKTSFEPIIIEGRNFTPKDFEDQTRTIIIDKNLSDKCIIRDGTEYFLHENNEYQVIGKFKSQYHRYVEQDKYDALYFVNMTASFDVNLDSMLNGNYSIDAEDKSFEFVNDFTTMVRQINPNIGVNVKKAISDNDLKNLEQAISKSIQMLVIYIFTILLILLNISSSTYYWIDGRKKEIAIRMLSGGKPSNIRWMMLRDYLLITTIGYGIGLLPAIMVLRSETFAFIGGTVYPVAVIVGYITCIGVGTIAGFISLTIRLKQNIIVQVRG